MKGKMKLIFIVALAALVLIAACVPRQGTGQVKPASSSDVAEKAAPTASTQKSVSTIESDIAGMDTLDTDLDTSDLDTLDKDLNFQI